jgi:hypothetical protein
MSETSKGSRSQSRLSDLMPEIRQRLIELGAPLLLTETEGRFHVAGRCMCGNRLGDSNRI